ncbi:formate dehydrogenase accessory sulfurtransferase FdhD [Segniliparus rugosus]|uniref:Sulfur carrier protein FdhD n=1 Tax=Segniliparus rugosus (strain ATCC BAA-974 / DSM 45345 / CCUG 50838 / CIP 108380 / JCM 13579 / CDC 945) TaxID=679197 RepID=E5XSS5_SEGRC|nr:formate dehydrogenase accessory sulfurtransferase FdhD [Segniliparus rugosus]EFV12602.1 formate dehydrogenase family accessory protein FdhD [Segniliparus rugosus ATCC BAA-974]
MGRVTVRKPVLRVNGATQTDRLDSLAVEEPLEIRLGGEALTLTMRTPGEDVDLVHGFLHAEGIVRHRDDVLSARYCAGTDPETGLQTYNVMDVALSEAAYGRAKGLGRSFAVSSACGVCGKTSLDQVVTASPYRLADDKTRFSSAMLAEAPDALRAAQRVFQATGGLHAAAVMDPDGKVLAVREDVGRHNAVDKAIGHFLRQGGLPLAGHALVVSGRASFELVQKAVLAGIPLLAAVSAPSSLAVDLAASAGLTLVGFLRGATMNVYTCPDRVSAPEQVS